MLSTDGQVQDFRFPQSSKGGATLQLSSNTVKVNSKHGKKTQKLHNSSVTVCVAVVQQFLNSRVFFSPKSDFLKKY